MNNQYLSNSYYKDKFLLILLKFIITPVKKIKKFEIFKKIIF